MTPSTRIPKHELVAQAIFDLYLVKLRPHQALPPERQLQNIFATSRSTIRHALRNLTNQGLIYQIKGSGSFRAEKGQKSNRVPSLAPFTQDMKARGHHPHSRTLSCQLLDKYPLQVQRDLDLAPGSQVLKIERLRQADGSPMALETAFFLPQVFSYMAPVENISLQSQMQASSHSVVQASMQIRATNLTQAEAQLLEVPQGSAALRIDKVGYTQRGMAVESTQILYRADRYDYQLEVSK